MGIVVISKAAKKGLAVLGLCLGIIGPIVGIGVNAGAPVGVRCGSEVCCGYIGYGSDCALPSATFLSPKTSDLRPLRNGNN